MYNPNVSSERANNSTNTRREDMKQVVHAPCGPVMGVQNKGVYQFHGIPYAQPPVGPLRFQKPRRMERWEETYDATYRHFLAPQTASDLDIPMGPTVGERNEDCLTLAISTPSLTGRLPVAVWFHGGANCYGGGDVAWYDGASLARSQQIVVVNLNFRLGPLGFLYYPGVIEENLSIEDQMMALHWIQDNIAAFGGDPGKVTLFGQSAGGNAIAHILSRPDSDGLFQQIILESASLGRGNHTRADASEIGTEVLKKLAIEPGTGALEALQKKSVSEIFEAVEAVPQGLREKHQGMIFKPIMDEWHTPEQTVHAAAQRAKSRKVRILMGFTREEMLAFIPGRDEKSLAVAEAMLQTRYVSPGDNMALEAAAGGCTVYRYRFDWKAAKSSFGACHCLELPFLFGNLESWNAPMLDGMEPYEGRCLTETMQGLWGRFVRGEEYENGLWPKFTAERKAMKVLNNEDNPVQDQ